MKTRRIAVMIDGGFFLKRLPSVILNEKRRDSAEKVSGLVHLMCKNHVKYITRCNDNAWLDNTYRIFFYDALPYDKQAHHPVENKQIDFAKSGEAIFRNNLFDSLRRTRKLALRLGKVIREEDWSPPSRKTRKILPTREILAELDLSKIQNGGNLNLSKQQVSKLQNMQNRWKEIGDNEIHLGFRQKGVDMRIGIDIASISLKQQADTIILIAGDSDFVPAAKLARREGVEFILDPMWQSVNEDLFEHIDGLQSGFKKPGDQKNGK